MEDTNTFRLNADTSETVLPVDSAFTGGSLELRHSASEYGTSVEEPAGVIDTLTVISIFAIIISLKKLVNVIPSMLTCLFRWKEAFNLEYSVKLSRDRDLFFLIFIIPFCILATKFSLYNPDFISGLGTTLRLLSTTGIFIAYLLLRRLLNVIFRSRDIDSNAYTAAVKLFPTYFCIISMACLISAGILSYTTLPEQTIRQVLYVEICVIYLIFIFRKSQIFGHYCSVFSTILYLCSLEILPTGLLVATAIFL